MTPKMNLPRVSLARPVTIMMFFLGVVLLGFISWNRLPRELFPPINYPQITVMTSYEGAAPEEIETLITKIIEEAVGTVNNVKRISSTSKEGISVVMIEFSWGTNMDFASLSVREKIDLIKERLPREAKEPLVMKYNPFDLPIITVSITGDKPALELRRVAKKMVKDELEKIEGVASVEIIGGLEREILVEIDQPRLQASGLSILEVVNTLRLANINYPAGTIKEAFYEYLIRTMGEFKAISEIQDVATAIDEPTEEEKEVTLTPEEKEKIEKKPKRLVFLRDISRIKDTTKERTSVSRYNGKENISLSVRKQSGANTILVVENVKKALAKLQQEISGINLEVVYDQSKFIKGSIAGVRDAAIQGGFLAFLVLFLFLGSVWPALNISFSIPISIMAVFSLMFLTGLSLNTISLGGLALGVGMLVDNAIVVLEAISLKKGNKREAIISGTNEVVAPITGSTLTTVAVFLPTIFVVGIAGQLFKELAFTVTFSLLASLVMALSLIPVFASVGRGKETGSPRLKFLSHPLQRVKELLISKKDTYTNFLSYLFIERRVYLLSVVFGLFVLSLILLFTSDRVLLPAVDQRQFILKIDKQPGTPLEETDRVAQFIEKILMRIPEVKNVTVNIGSSKDRPQEEIIETLGSHQAQILVNLKSKKDYIHSTNEVLQHLKTVLGPKELEENMNIEYLAQESVLKTAFGEQAPIVLEIKGLDLNQLASVGTELRTELENIPGLYGVKTSLVSPSPETKANIIKDRASLYNLSVRDIALTAQTAIKGYVATKFKERQEGEEIDIRVRLRESDRSDFTNLRNILIFSQLRNIQVPLSEVAYLTRGLGPTQIKRLDQQRAVVVSANIFKRGFNQVSSDINKVIFKLQKRSQGYTIIFGGQTQAMQESFGSLRFALILSIILVYMIMAGEFESLWQPFVIMFTLPLSIIGAVLLLKLTGTSLSVVVLLGMIMLGGIVVNNGIVLIEYTNLLRREGKSVEEALLQADLRRLRPILMTSLTTILGLFPLALGLGEGSELMAPLAITVIGGLTSSTFLTLAVIPALYLIFDRLFSHPIFSLRFRLMPAQEEVTVAIPEIPATPEISSAPVTATVLTPETPALAAPAEPEAVLNERQTRLLEILREKGRLSRAEYAQLFAISVPTAARDLKDLIEKGYILARGPLGPGRYYILNKDGQNPKS